jgi:hypothetical protein
MKIDPNWEYLAGYDGYRVLVKKDFKPLLPGMKFYRIDRRFFFLFWYTVIKFIA